MACNLRDCVWPLFSSTGFWVISPRTAIRPLWFIALCVVMFTSSSPSSDVLNCDDYSILCVHGICKNNTLTGVISCVCDRGWTGTSCQHCYGRRNISDSSGFITDGPGNYSIDTKCTWLIEAPPDTPIRLRFEHFATECSWDHVYVYDGSSVYDATLAVVSGLILPEWKVNRTLPEITAHSGSAYIHFYSDAAYSMNGFNISYVVGSCPLDCSGHGDCESTGQCDCDPGWRGDGCDIAMCPSDCNAWGECTGTDDSMYCDCKDSPFRGVDCSIPDMKGVWKEVQQMPSDNVPHARASHASLIQEEDGKHYMYIVSGYDFGNPVNLDLIRYNFKQGLWEQILLSSVIEPAQRYGHAVAGHEDKIYMYGGIIGTSVTDELWMFDTKRRSWEQITNVSMHVASERPARIAVVGHSAHIINGVMYVIFGHSPIYGYLNHVQKFHIASNTWEVTTGTGALVKGGYGHSGVYDANSDQIFVHAGYYSTSASAYSLTDTLYAYAVTEGSWKILPSSGEYKYLHSAVILNDLMLVFGGNTHNDTLHSQGAKCFSTNFMVYDIACQEWYNLDKPLLPQNVARFGHIAEVYDEKMFVFGGFNGRVLYDMYHYEPGICTSHEDKESCLSSREGVKCVWVNDDRCEYPALAEDQYAHKNIQLIDAPKCDSRLYDLSIMCKTYRTCSSCVANDFNCAWCGSRCDRRSACEDREQALYEVQCLMTFEESSKSCTNHHNCYSCYKDPACYWKSSDNSCEVSKGREHSAGTADELCEAPCFNHESCENCTLSSCMWCSSQKQCVESNSYVPSFPYGQCMEWTTLKSKCPATRCAELRSCDECQNLPACGWCNDGANNGLGTCMDGSRDGPVAFNGTLQPDMCPHTWFFVQCPLCQCNGHSPCEINSDVCVECLNETMGEQCQYCKDGYWGVATNGGHCQACECYDQADSCQRDTGSCFCNTRGVKGEQCDTCDEANEYFGDPKTGGTCYYKLTTDFAFTFNLSKEENRHITRINFMNMPSNEDRDVDFSISCSGSAYLNITIKEDNSLTERHLHSEECTYLKYKFKHSEFKFGSRHNTTFFVYIFDFNTPFRLQVSFSQYTQIDLVHFFVTFFSCFLSLLLIAAMFWKVKQKYDLYRRRQRLVVQMEQMASRPFASCNLEIEPVGPASAVIQRDPPDLRRSGRNRRKQSAHTRPSPVALEPLSRQKAAILTLIIRLPTGDEDVTPSGQSGIALASTLVTLGNPRKSSSDHLKGDKASKGRKPAAGLGNCV